MGRPDFLVKKRDGLTSELHFQVNTLVETSLIRYNLGTNYTIGPSVAGLNGVKELISTTKVGDFTEFFGFRVRISSLDGETSGTRLRADPQLSSARRRSGREHSAIRSAPVRQHMLPFQPHPAT